MATQTKFNWKTLVTHIIGAALSLPAAIPSVAALFHLSATTSAKITALAAAISVVAGGVAQLLGALGVKVAAAHKAAKSA